MRTRLQLSSGFLVVKRRSGSSTSSLLGDYITLLHKKLLFQVHPDFFTQWPSEQRVNMANVQQLASYISQAASSTSQFVAASPTTPRSLTFYIKPSEASPQSPPRRVKVSLVRLVESMREILVDLVAELPDPPSSSSYGVGGDGEGGGSASGIGSGSGSAYRSGYKSNLSAAEVVRFLDDLTDRRDLIAWRALRTQSLSRTKEVVASMLGERVTVDMRCSLSAQYSAVLFTRLLDLLIDIGQGRTRIDGLKCILTADDFHHPVDAVEGHVLLNPGHVEMQWRSTLESVTPAHVEEAKVAATKVAELRIAVETGLGAVVRAALNKAGQDLTAAQLGVRVTRGHTCSQRWFRHWLQEWQSGGQDGDSQEMDVVVARLLGSAKPIVSTAAVASAAATTPTPATTPATTPAPTAKSSALVAPTSWLSRLPLTLTITIEEGHGTRLLPSGGLRIDCRATRPAMLVLLTDAALLHSAAQLTSDASAADAALQQLVSKLRDGLGLASLEAGVGVGSTQFAEFLRRIDDYLAVQRRRSDAHRGILAALAGLRVRAGLYLGLTDDGCVNLPWEIALPPIQKGHGSAQ